MGPPDLPPHRHPRQRICDRHRHPTDGPQDPLGPHADRGQHQSLEQDRGQQHEQRHGGDALHLLRERDEHDPRDDERGDVDQGVDGDQAESRADLAGAGGAK